MDIDLVYLWVDGSDPKWRAKFNATAGIQESTDAESCKGRYYDNDELLYSLRSVEMYAPWVRRIFIVTDNQIPEWLNTDNPKIRVVGHTEILPPQSLPCFNSNILLHHLHLIPGLAEHFLYSDDDTFLNRPATPATFFTPDGLPIMRFYKKRHRKLALFYRTKILRKPLEHFIQGISNSADAVERKYGRYYQSKPHHNIDAYLRSDFQDTYEQFSADITPTLTNHLRRPNDLQRVLYAYAALAKGKAIKHYASQQESFRLMIHHRERYALLESTDPQFFCLNDSQHATDDDRRRAAEFLRRRFPTKSQFEK